MLWEWVNSGTQVFILDLDGTLMPSAEIDNEYYWQAVFTYVGDGAWDLQASRELDRRFIGIAHGRRAERLRLAGAAEVRNNFCKP